MRIWTPEGSGVPIMLSARFLDTGVSYLRLSPEQEQVRTEILRRIETGDYELEHVDCFCGASDDVQLAARDRYGLPVDTWLCRACGLLRSTPRLDPPSLARFYTEQYRALYSPAQVEVEEFFGIQREQGRGLVRQLSSLMDQIDSVFEVGCGAGGFLEAMREQGKRVAGVDLGDNEYLEYGKSRGLDLLAGDATTLHEARGCADLVMCIHVAEHFSDLRHEIAQLRQLLRPGGWLLVWVPGVFDLSARYRGDFLLYLQNAHNYHFTARTLAMVLESCGLHVAFKDERAMCLAVPHEEVAVEGAPAQLAIPDPQQADQILAFLRDHERAFFDRQERAS